MPLSRRAFLGTSAAAGGAVAARSFLLDQFDVVQPASGLPLAQEMIDDVAHTTCWIGKQDCGIRARRIDGRVIKLEGLPGHPRNRGTLCPKGQAQIVSIYDPNRVKTPLIRTNGKGEKGEFRRASWDEALDLVAAKAREVREDDPSLLLWQKGRSKAGKFYDDAFVKAAGATKLGHGAYCSDTGYRAVEYITGLHGVLHPDMVNTRYLLSWGWNLTNAGGNKFCWITWPQQMLQARDQGLEIVHIDPRLRGAGPFADQWLPIRPATDLALALAICHELIANGHVDREYLTNYTDAPYLVGSDGLFVRDDDGNPLVWDLATERAVPVAEASEPALEGTFDVDGDEAAPGFQRFVDHVADATPQWAADICGLEAADISRVAREFGEKAMIGATVVVDGVEVPHRPVGIMAYHMAQQELGFNAVRAMLMIPMLVGAIGAHGGQLADFSWKIHKNFEKFEDLVIDDPPYDFTLAKSRFFPINSGFPGALAKVMQDPDAFEVERLPRMVILHMVNPVVSFPSREDFLATYGEFEFVVDISPWLSETADLFADVILPAATIEKYEGPIDATDQYVEAVTLRLPPMEPLFESRGEIDIYLDLCERIGILDGEDGYLAHVNAGLGLEGSQYALPTDTRPEVRDIFDRWARNEGLEEGIGYFERNGVWVKGQRPATELYGYVTDPPFGGIRHRFYGESLLRAREEMKARGTPESYWQDYTALPTWRPPTMTESPDDYDLTLISYKLVEHKQSRTSLVPLLAELSGPQRIDINASTAERLGISDGDEVIVESHNAITGETRSLRTVAAVKEGIRPDVVAMPHHFGMWTHPSSDGLGPSPNELFFTGEGYQANTADQSFHVKVKVRKA